ncbi:MAG: hypothetical protein H6937_06375 [Burkholderiales bacterium]|nr:hypothetical protein [Burkholderiales bacterium]MDR4515962.1 DUF4175 domain-containing protein [Nitrosomonas sp.]
MSNIHLKQVFYTVGLFLAASIAGLWSWNTLSELFNWPPVAYKHVLAIFILLMIVRWSLFTGRRNFKPLSADNPEHLHQ